VLHPRGPWFHEGHREVFQPQWVEWTVANRVPSDVRCLHALFNSLSATKGFIKSAGKVKDLLTRRSMPSASGNFGKLVKETDNYGELVGFPALEAVLDAFEIVSEAQTRCQASEEPNMHLDLPLLQRCYDELDRVAGGGTVWREGRDNVASSRYSRAFCRLMVESLDSKVRFHDLRLAGCFIHPFLREFQFIANVDRRREYKRRGERVVRRLCFRK